MEKRPKFRKPEKYISTLYKINQLKYRYNVIATDVTETLLKRTSLERRRPLPSTLFASPIGQDGLLDDVVAQEEVSCDNVGRVPPQIVVPTVDLED